MVTFRRIQNCWWLRVLCVLCLGVTGSFLYADEKPPLSSPKDDKGKNINRGVITGTVATHKLDVKDAFYVWNPGADDLSLFLSDAPNACELLKENALPKNATVLSVVLKHNTRENQDSPFSTGSYPLRLKGEHKNTEDQDTKRAFFAKLDGQCRSKLSRTQDQAVEGSVKVTSGQSGDDGYLEGSFTFVVGEQGDGISGTFSAYQCARPLDSTEMMSCR